MTDTTETAHALLYRHGLPEDVIDGALCLHAQELAAEIRYETDRLKFHGVLEPDKYRPCRDAANQIDPTINEHDPDAAASAVVPAADRAALRDCIRRAVCEAEGFAWNPELLEPDEYGEVADAVLAVLPAPADRGAVLREAEEALRQRGKRLAGEFNGADILHEDGPAATVATWKRAADVLGRMAVEAAVVDRVAAETPPAETLNLVTRVLEIFSLSHADAYEDLFWRVDDGQVRLFANVSDVFAWGCADCEPITPDTLPALEQAYADLKAVGAEEFTAELYTARQRGVRPQGAAYPGSSHEAWRKVADLYNACGPERKTGLGNPRPVPGPVVPAQPGNDTKTREA